MEFVFNVRKAAQAAALLLERHGGSMPYIKLVKLLYLADRQSLIESGYPITGDRFVSMDHGPVVSHILNLITWERDRGAAGPDPVWTAYISDPSGYEIRLRPDGEHGSRDELSDYDREVLDGIFEQFGSWDRWDLVKYTHTLPEWQDPDGTSLAIDVRLILEDAGLSADEIKAIASQAAAVRAFDAAYAATP